jgi:hypothetical protein
MDPMVAIHRLTVHHEGAPDPVWFTDAQQTAQRLDKIRRAHLQRMNAGDIGYHLVIDRAGRLWSGRPLKYQGAHVKDHNERNLGIMVLGNFELQEPTEAQLNTLTASLAGLMRRFNLGTERVHTHRELMPTVCPGKRLQPKIVALRRSPKLLGL